MCVCVCVYIYIYIYIYINLDEIDTWQKIIGKMLVITFKKRTYICKNPMLPVTSKDVNGTELINFIIYDYTKLNTFLLFLDRVDRFSEVLKY